MSRGTRTATIGLALLLATLLRPPPATAAAPVAHDYAQPARPLAVQLAEVAALHRVNLVWPAVDAAARVAPGLHGRYALAAALDALLQPHDLHWRRLADGSIRIEATAALLRLRIGTVDVAAANLADTAAAPQPAALAESAPGEPAPLLAQRTAAGWTYAAPALRTLPATDLGRWLSRSPNAYGQGSRLSLRGIERDSFAAQTSSVRLDGLPLSARALDAALPLPPGLAQIDFALGPQPERLVTPGFAGALGLATPLPVPLAQGRLRLGGGDRALRRIDLEQGLDLAAAGSARLAWIDRRQQGRVQHADGRPQARERLALGRWLLEPEALPALTVGAELLWIRAAPADQRLSVPLGTETFDPARRRDLELSRQVRLAEQGGRLGARWSAAHWSFDSSHLLLDSREQVDGPGLLDAGERRLAGERSQVHQLAASRAVASSPYRLRLALDLARRRARFVTTDQLALERLFPPDGGFVVGPGSFRSLSSGLQQRIASHGAQLWLGAEWPRLALEAGTAWAQEERRELATLQRSTSAGCTLTDRDGRVQPCTALLAPLDRRTSTQLRDRRLTPAVTVLWTPAAAAGQFGLQWRRGARSGGARASGSEILPFQPERSDTLEASWRSPQLGRVSARLALFRNAWRDRQVQLPDPGQSGSLIVNAGRARASGAELTLQAELGADWRLALGLGHLRTRFERFQLAAIGAPQELAGNAFPGAPRHSAVLGLHRAPERGLEFGLLLHASGAAEGDAFNRPAARLPGRAELDLRLGWRGQRHGLGLELENALDRGGYERVELSLIGDTPRSYQPAAPRQLRATLEWRW